MNYIDLIIILFILASLLRGAEVGFVRQLFSAAGFFGGLMLGVWLQPQIVRMAHTPLARAWLTLAITLGPALVLLAVAEYVGTLVRSRIHRESLDYADRTLGSLVSLTTLIITIWFGAAILIRLPFPALQNELRGSAIIRYLDQHLPSAPNTISQLGRIIYPNGFPQVFVGLEPAPTNPNIALPSGSAIAAAVSRDAASVVKIQGNGCGGIVEGSGFIVGPDLVATNAHVVAGISHPFIITGNGELRTSVIWFDPNLDFAVLRVPGLSGRTLSISDQISANGVDGAVLGYPGGGGFSAQPAAVMDEFTATGRNIYGQGIVSRDIYELKATVIPGNSGGPLINTNGTVIGVVFAQSTTYNQVGYALTTPQVVSELHQAESRNQTVSTGQCAE